MTSERAKEIIKAAQKGAVGVPWVDRLDKIMTEAERKEVNQVWDTLPGNTCFVDALYRIANGR